jgi:hypothetical protein
MDAAQRTGIRILVGDYGVGKMRIPFRMSHQDHAPGSLGDLPGYMVDQSRAAVRQKSLVPSHPGAAAADQNETGTPHERMISFVLGTDGPVRV